MSGTGRKQSPGRPAAAGLGSALVAIARARRESQLVEAVSAAAQARLGALAAALCSREADRPLPHPLLRLVDPSAMAAVRPASLAVAEIMRRGAPVQLGPGEIGGAAGGVPEGTGLVTVVPAAGANSTSALAVFWAAGHGAAGRRPRDDLVVLAAAAGLALERLDAMRRERAGSADLEHRLRNVIAMIRSVSTRSCERAASLEAFTLHFDGRLDALARPQVALARSGGSRVPFDPLLREELLAQGIQEGPQVALQGMPVALERALIEPLGLALHELAVNAIKFGAFSEKGGSLAIRWWMESGADGLTLRLHWREWCLLPVDPEPAHVGFGRTMVEQALPYELGARTSMRFGADGLDCRIAVPVPDRVGRR